METEANDRLIEYRLAELEKELAEAKRSIKALELKEQHYIRAALIALGGAVVSLGVYIWRLKIG